MVCEVNESIENNSIEELMNGEAWSSRFQDIAHEEAHRQMQQQENEGYETQSGDDSPPQSDQDESGTESGGDSPSQSYQESVPETSENGPIVEDEWSNEDNRTEGGSSTPSIFYYNEESELTNEEQDTRRVIVTSDVDDQPGIFGNGSNVAHKLPVKWVEDEYLILRADGTDFMPKIHVDIESNALSLQGVDTI